jgi:hypothetical protein
MYHSKDRRAKIFSGRDGLTCQLSEACSPLTPAARRRQTVVAGAPRDFADEFLPTKIVLAHRQDDGLRGMEIPAVQRIQIEGDKRAHCHRNYARHRASMTPIR